MPKRSPGSRSADDINKRFGTRLRTLRENADRSQTDVGQALRVSFQQIQKYENGTTSISLDRLDELASFFGTSVAHLVKDLGVHGLAAVAGFAESEQDAYDDGSARGPQVALMSKETVALVDAFNRIRDRKLRRSLLAVIEAYSDREEGELEGSARP